MSVSDRLVSQRVRNRQIEAIEGMESAEAMAEVGVFETLNIWDDFYQIEYTDSYAPPVYSPQERDALERVEAAVGVVADGSDVDSRDADQIRRLPGISALFAAAKAASEVFAVRGRLDEERELSDEELAE